MSSNIARTVFMRPSGNRPSIGVTTFWGMVAATLVGMVLTPSLYVITRSMSETTKKVLKKIFGAEKVLTPPVAQNG